MEVKTKSASLAVEVVYMVSGVVVNDTNVQRLQQIAEFLMAIETPWVLIGDSNVEPLLLHQRGLCELVCGGGIETSNVEHTCDKGTRA